MPARRRSRATPHSPASPPPTRGPFRAPPAPAELTAEEAFDILTGLTPQSPVGVTSQAVAAQPTTQVAATPTGANNVSATERTFNVGYTAQTASYTPPVAVGPTITVLPDLTAERDTTVDLVHIWVGKPSATKNGGVNICLHNGTDFATLASWEKNTMARLLAMSPGRQYDLVFTLSADAKRYRRHDGEVSLVTKQLLRVNLIPGNTTFPAGLLTNFPGDPDPAQRKGWSAFHYRFDVVVVGVSGAEVTFVDLASASDPSPTVMGVLPRDHAGSFIARNNVVRPAHTVSTAAGLIGTVWSVVALPAHGWRQSTNLVGLTDPLFDEWRFLGCATPSRQGSQQ